MSAVRGSVVVDELVIPIRGVRLQRGMFVIHAEAGGPLPAVNSTRYVVVGEDGRAVYRSSGLGPALTWPKLDDGDTVAITIDAAVIGGVSNPPT